MNINLKFENVTWQKKIGYVAIAIALCIFIGITIIVISVLTNHYNKQVFKAREEAELVSENIASEVGNVTDSLEYISNLISDEEMKSHISSSQVTSLLNQLISKDEKVFGAFVMLDKSEFNSIEKETKEISKEFTSDKEADEALDILENNEDIEHEEVKEVVVPRDSIVDGVNKFVYKANGSTFETNLDRLNTLEYKKSYMKVMLTKKPQMMSPQTNSYNGVEITTATYTVPIIVDGNFEGIIGIDIDIEKLKGYLQDKSKNLSSDFIITDKEGNIVGSSNKLFEASTIQDVYKGSTHKKTLEYVTTNLESGITSSFNTGSSDLVHDEVLVMLPIIIEDNHVWNIIFITNVDKVITNSIATILLVSIINLVLFALFIALLWFSFSSMLTNKYNHLFKRVDTELTKIKANSTKIMEDLEDIEEITIIDSDVDEEDVKEFLPEKEEKKEEPKTEEVKTEEPKAEESKAEEVKPEEPKVEEPKAEEPKVEETKVEEPKIEEAAPEAPAPEETPAEEPAPQPEEPAVEDNGFDAEAFAKARVETDEKYQAAEEENKKEAGEAPSEEPATNAEETSSEEAPAIEEAKADADLEEILQNKDGKIEDDSFMADAEAKLAQAMEQQKAEEPKAEEPKIEEPKVEEPKVEEPKVEEPKVEAPKPAPKEAAPEVDLDKPIQAAPPKKEKDYYSVKLEPEDDDFQPREHKLSAKEMDDLLKELEGKRKQEAEASGQEYVEMNVEEASISDLLGASSVE